MGISKLKVNQDRKARAAVLIEAASKNIGTIYT